MAEKLEPRVLLSSTPFAAEKFATGGSPEQVVAADLNGDGVPDLVTVDSTPSEVSIFIAKGDGTFLPRVAIEVDSRPHSVAAGDIDNDGDIDLVTASNFGDTVTVLRNVGDGTFLVPADLDTQDSPEHVALADVNNDTLLDIIVAGNSPSSPGFSVMLGAGAGTFAAHQAFMPATRATYVVAGDFDQDNHIDLVIADGDKKVYYVEGNGDGTFQLPTTIIDETFSDPTSLVAEDFDNDGALDLAVARSFFQDEVEVFKGLGNGSFSQRQVITVESRPGYIASGDFDDDGVLDLASVNLESKDFSIMFGTGSGTFAAPVAYLVGAGIDSVAVGDFNGDGFDDLSSSVSFNDGVVVMLNRGDGTFDQIKKILADDFDPLHAVSGDFNGDGNQDLAGVHGPQNEFMVALGTGAGEFNSLTTVEILGSPEFVATGDLNGDGVLDIVTANRQADEVSVLLGLGNGGFGAEQRFDVVADPTSVVLGDVNDDDILDLAVNGDATNNVAVLLGNGDGTFQTQQTFAVRDTPVSIDIGDLNGDGVKDIAVAVDDFFDHALAVAISNGNGTFKSPTYLPTRDIPVGVAISDLNADGLLDLVSANPPFDTSVSVFLGAGGELFQAEQSYDAIDRLEWIHTTDYNGDGVPDVLTTSAFFADTAGLRAGVGDGTLEPVRRFVIGDNPDAVIADDFNNDGVVDLVGVSTLMGMSTISFGLVQPAPAEAELQVMIDGAALEDGQPQSINFGTASFQGGAPGKVVTLMNAGGEDLSLSFPGVPLGFGLESGYPVDPLTPGEHVEIVVRLTTGKAGDFDGQLVIPSSDPTSPLFSIPVTGVVGSGVSPSIAVEVDGGFLESAQPDAINFGSVMQGTGSPGKVFTIHNTGDEALSLGFPEIPAGFGLESGYLSTIGPGESADIVLRLTTGASGDFEGEFIIPTNDPVTGFFRVPIVGMVQEDASIPSPDAQIAVIIDGQAIVDTQIDPIHFGAADYQGGAPGKTFIIENVGTSPLSLGFPSLPVGFGMESGYPVTPLGPGESAEIVVRLTTGKEGSFSGLFEIPSTDASNPQFSFPLTGVVGDPGQPKLAVVVDGNTLTDGQSSAINYGTANRGGGAPGKVFTLHNTGSKNLNLGFPQIPVGFGMESGYLSMIPAGGSTDIVVRLTTGVTGGFSGDFVVPSDDPDAGLFSFPLTGQVADAGPAPVAAGSAGPSSAGPGSDARAAPPASVSQTALSIFAATETERSVMPLASSGDRVAAFDALLEAAGDESEVSMLSLLMAALGS